MGSLEVGKKADIILVDFDQAHISPMNRHYDLVTNLVYNADGRSVHTVIVDGHVMVAAHKPLFVGLVTASAVVFTALNEGAASPNTVTFTLNPVFVGLATQSVNQLTGASSQVQVTVP